MIIVEQRKTGAEDSSATVLPNFASGHRSPSQGRVGATLPRAALILGAVVQGYVLAAAAHGLHEQIVLDRGDPDAILSNAGIDLQHLGEMRVAIQLDRYVNAMELAATNTGNDNFGLHYGQGFSPERLGLIGLIALASPDLGTALSNLVQVFPLHQQMTKTSLREARGLSVLQYQIVSGSIVSRRQDAELTLGMFANIFRRCLGPQWSPVEIHCEHPKPDGWTEIERLFNGPVCFSQQKNAILFDNTELTQKMPSSDPARLAELLDDLRSLNRPKASLSLTDQVRNAIRSHLSEGNCNITEISDEFAMPRWKLQRALDREGENFANLVDGVRRQLSLVYLRNWQLPLTEIALLLGYSELSAFTRSFDRWHGGSPSEWRRCAKAPR